MSMASIIDGKIISAELRARVAAEVARLKGEHGLTPGRYSNEFMPASFVAIPLLRT